MSFQDAVTTVFTQKYADFSGRARRSEYWFAYLGSLLAYLLVMIIAAVINFPSLVFILALALVVPGLAVSVRRMHDGGRSGWVLLLTLIPLVGLIVLYWAVSDGDPGTNQYGPSPKGAELNQAPGAGWGQS